MILAVTSPLAQKELVGPVNRGSGKWVITETDQVNAKSALALVANRLSTMGDEGRAFGSSTADYENTVRYVEQEWQPFSAQDVYDLAQSNPDFVSAVYDYGTSRIFTQSFLPLGEGFIDPNITHAWRPFVPTQEYEAIE